MRPDPVRNETALEHKLMVITDEAYEYFTFDGHRHFSIAAIPGMEKNVISCFTFTKTYALTGWRIGFSFGKLTLDIPGKRPHIGGKDKIMTGHPPGGPFHHSGGPRPGPGHLIGKKRFIEGMDLKNGREGGS